MAKLYFRYGAMGASKTAQALMVKYNYEERGKKVLLVKPVIDTRDGVRTIRSRAGLSAECVFFDEMRTMDIKAFLSIACVIVDEAQFLSENDILFLTDIVDNLDVPVICYGLRTDFQGNLFPGSEVLLRCADTIEEIKTICWCGHKATCNARIGEDGKVLKEGPQIALGSNDKYVALCRKHWKKGQLSKEKL